MNKIHTTNGLKLSDEMSSLKFISVSSASRTVKVVSNSWASTKTAMLELTKVHENTKILRGV